MTTIAWDGKTLAADKQMTYYNTPIGVEKIFPIGKTKFLAGCGCMDEIVSVVDWMRKGRRGRKPRVRESLFLLVDKRKKTCYFLSGNLLEINIEGCLAIGSGQDFAMAAMKLGKTAVEAVEFASTMDVSTGVGISKIEV